MKLALDAARRDPELGAALALHRAGDLAGAIEAYRTILQARPRDANTAFLCGMAALQAGAHGSAAQLFTAACQFDPARADFHANLGLALAQGGDLAAGAGPLMRALVLAPEGAETAHNLGQVLERTGKWAAAFIAFRASAHLQPGHAVSWTEYGSVARLTGRPGTANIALLMALKIDPGSARAWFNIAMLRADQGIDADAETGFRRAVDLNPGYVEAVANLGNHLRGQQRREEARAVLRDGIARAPMMARLWAGLSAVDFDEDRIASARAAALRACVLDPGHVEGWANMAQCALQDGDSAAAVRLGISARRLAPDDSRLRFNLATYQLGHGDLAAGWHSYEARLARIPEGAATGLPGVRWRRGTPPGRRLLVTAEQGLGDELLFATCLTDLRAHLGAGGLEALVVECDARLAGLFRRSLPGIETIDRLSTRATNDRPADYTDAVRRAGIDCHVPAGSLPGLLRPDLASFRRNPPRFDADPDRVAHFRSFLASRGDLPVLGLTWRSMRRRDRGAVYYPPIESLGPIVTRPDVRFVTLQYDGPEADLRAIEARYGIQILRPPDLDPMNDLDGVAALMTACDGVVTAYTAVLNLAGILGVPAYTGTYGYYWPTLGTGGLPWYPSVRIEMRGPHDAWDDVMGRLAARLKTGLEA